MHTVPDTSNVFRAIDGVRDRKITLDTAERREIYVEQTSTVGALWFKKQFTTALNVTELPKDVAMKFDLAQPGLMSKFQVRTCLCVRLHASLVCALALSNARRAQ